MVETLGLIFVMLGGIAYLLHRLFEKVDGLIKPPHSLSGRVQAPGIINLAEEPEPTKAARVPWAVQKRELEGQQTVEEKRSERVQKFRSKKA